MHLINILMYFIISRGGFSLFFLSFFISYRSKAYLLGLRIDNQRCIKFMLSKTKVNRIESKRYIHSAERDVAIRQIKRKTEDWCSVIFRFFFFSKSRAAGQAKSGWRRENQPEIHAGQYAGWSAQAGINVSRLILLIYLLPQRPTIRNCTRMRRIRPIRGTEPEIEPRGVERARKNERQNGRARGGKGGDTARYRWEYRKMYTEQ